MGSGVGPAIVRQQHPAERRLPQPHKTAGKVNYPRGSIGSQKVRVHRMAAGSIQRVNGSKIVGGKDHPQATNSRYRQLEGSHQGSGNLKTDQQDQWCQSARARQGRPGKTIRTGVLQSRSKCYRQSFRHSTQPRCSGIEKHDSTGQANPLTLENPAYASVLPLATAGFRELCRPDAGLNCQPASRIPSKATLSKKRRAIHGKK